MLKVIRALAEDEHVGTAGTPTISTMKFVLKKVARPKLDKSCEIHLNTCICANHRKSVYHYESALIETWHYCLQI